MVDKKVAIGIAVVVVLLILFYLSPYSETEHQQTCVGFPFETASPEGAQVSPVCGDVIGGSMYLWPFFPFREKSDARVEFCREKQHIVDEACGFETDTVLFNGFSPPTGQDFFTCDYIEGNENQSIAVLVEITNYSDAYLASDFAKESGTTDPLEVSEVDAGSRDFLTTTVCNNLTEKTVAGN
jgi:hypothetical protein